MYTRCIQLSQIPQYLRGGEFYGALDHTEDEDIQIPFDVMKFDTEIHSNTDLRDYLSSLRFWGVSKVSANCIDYILRSHIYCSSVLDGFVVELKTIAVLHNLIRIRNRKERVNIAIKLGDIEVLERLFVQGYPVLHDACDIAAGHSNCSVLKCLVSFGGLLSNRTVQAALRAGNLEIVKYLETQGYSITSDMIIVESFCREGKWVLSVGNVACLQHAFEQGCTLTATIAVLFARRNQLDMLRYVHEHGCPWTERTTIAAAMAGSLECLIYAHQHGCMTTISAYAAAKLYQHGPCMMYLEQQGIYY